MKLKKSLLFTLVLVVIAGFIHIYSNDAVRVENQYSTGIYPVFGRVLRYLFGWIPFSLGDVLYGSVIIWLGWKLVKGIKALFKRRPPQSPEGGRTEEIEAKFRKQAFLKSFGAGTLKFFRSLLIIYIIFNAFWGINYNRIGIANQLQLKMDKYKLEDLKTINGLLAEKTNAAKQALMNGQVKYPANKQLFAKVKDAYQQAEKLYPFLKYH
ncbi:MAG TPA: DUF3810 family protein, partial [Ferruginibacter sp.]|nr:DUF3810 family protein [Ferruginibacter sp.]